MGAGGAAADLGAAVLLEDARPEGERGLEAGAELCNVVVRVRVRQARAQRLDLGQRVLGAETLRRARVSVAGGRAAGGRAAGGTAG